MDSFAPGRGYDDESLDLGAETRGALRSHLPVGRQTAATKASLPRTTYAATEVKDSLEAEYLAVTHPVFGADRADKAGLRGAVYGVIGSGMG